MLEGDSVTLKGISKSLLPETRFSDPIYLESSIHLVWYSVWPWVFTGFLNLLGGVHLSGDCYGFWGILRMRKSDNLVKQLELRGHILIQVYAYRRSLFSFLLLYLDFSCNNGDGGFRFSRCLEKICGS